MTSTFIVLIAATVFSATDSTRSVYSDTGMVLVPGGYFNRGSMHGQRDERPIHRVHIDSFYMGKTEVTVWEYLNCVNSGQCRMPLWWNKHFFEQGSDDLPGRDWLNMPVTGISWDDAQRYCAWVGAGARLPTEGEWEYAARAGASNEYFWGDDMKAAGSFAVVDKGLSRVMSRKPNSWGLYDMIGNAWEWCADRYAKDYYRVSPGNDPHGPEDAKKYPYRVVRGGAWNEYHWNLRCANRSYGEQFRRYQGLGFRICRSVHSK
jgi:sulfatase modifying factor 1